MNAKVVQFRVARAKGELPSQLPRPARERELERLWRKAHVNITKLSRTFTHQEIADMHHVTPHYVRLVLWHGRPPVGRSKRAAPFGRCVAVRWLAGE